MMKIEPSKDESSNGTEKNETPSSFPKLDPNSRFATEYNIIYLLGGGTFGQVYKVHNKLDNNIYAVKRIQLPLNENENKKIKEVELLSKLNLTNVVRYFTAWIESGPELDDSDITFDEIDKKENDVNEDNECDSVVSFLRQTDETNTNSDTSNSSGTEEEETSYRFLHIQMEFCEKSTLRDAINNKLYQDEDRVWQLLEQIVQGLADLHNHDVIHGDLKPENIFIAANDCVKIGDFGLAMTVIRHNSSQGAGDSGASQFNVRGTPLYWAPEVADSEIPRYDKKNDMYSLGIIFFEMCLPPFENNIERYNALSAVGNDPTKIENYCISTQTRKRVANVKQNSVGLNDRQKKLISELLNHDFDARPTAAEILRSDRITLDKRYKHSSVKRRKVVNQNDGNISKPRLNYIIDVDYHDPTVQKANFLEIMKDKACKIFLLHGGVYTASCLPSDSIDESSSYHHSKTFAQYLVKNPRIVHMKRYTFNELSYESLFCDSSTPFTCARFDIVGPNPNNTAMEAEALLVICEFLEKCSGRVPMRDFVIRLNHGSLVPAIIKYVLSKFLKKDNYMELSENETSCINLALKEYASLPGLHDLDVEKWQQILNNNVSSEPLSSHVLHLNRDAWTKQQNDIEGLKRLVHILKSLKIKCPIVIAPSLMKGYKQSKIMFQVVRKEAKDNDPSNKVVAAGVRYDKMIELCKSDSEAKRHTKQSAVGLTIYLDQFVDICQPENEFLSKISVLICSADSSHLLVDKLQFAADLWAAEISGQVSYIDHKNLEEVEGYATVMKIPYIVYLEEVEKPVSMCSSVTLCSWNHDRFQRKAFTATSEVISYLRKVVKA